MKTTRKTTTTMTTKRRKKFVLFTLFLLHQCNINIFFFTIPYSYDNNSHFQRQRQHHHQYHRPPRDHTHIHPIHPTGCHGLKSGDTFPCPCSTGMIHMEHVPPIASSFDKRRETQTQIQTTKTIVYNKCSLGIKNGAYHGIYRVRIQSTYGEMGMAVYSTTNNLDLCGREVGGGLGAGAGGEDGNNGNGNDNHEQEGEQQGKCHCTCFTQDAVDGAVGFQTSTSISSKERGYITDCLGLCGPHCEQGKGKGKGSRDKVNSSKGGIRYASILIHDICQSFIRSNDPMPNSNACSDEGWSALTAAVLSTFTNGYCPKTVQV